MKSKIRKNVQQTTVHYDAFQMNAINRVLSNASGLTPRSDLLSSMKREGYRKSEPIKCIELPDGKMKIIDGHNRFVTARFLNLPVEFICYEDQFDISPAVQAQSQKAWTSFDYTKVYADLGDADYAEVEEFYRQSGIPHSSCYALFAGDVAGTANYHQQVKLGRFKIKNRENPYKVGMICSALKHSCDFGTTSYLVNAVSKVIHIEGFDITRMCERIYRHSELLERKRNTDDYIALLELIYNRNTKSEKLYFREGVAKAMAKRSCVGKKG